MLSLQCRTETAKMSRLYITRQSNINFWLVPEVFCVLTLLTLTVRTPIDVSLTHKINDTTGIVVHHTRFRHLYGLRSMY